MADFILEAIKQRADSDLQAGIDLYRKFFVNTKIYQQYKDSVDDKLALGGYQSVVEKG